MRCNGFNTKTHAHTHKYHPQTQCVPFSIHKANPNNEPSVISSSSLNNNDKDAVAFCCIHHTGNGFCCYLEQHALIRLFVLSFFRSLTPPKKRNFSQTRSEKETSLLLFLFIVICFVSPKLHTVAFMIIDFGCCQRYAPYKTNRKYKHT